MELLDNPIRTYAWGSRTVIAELLGEDVPAPHPQAEMWLGAHPAAPSTVRAADRPDGRRALHELIGEDPVAALGPGRDRWAGRLPFLLKVLAAEEPLSLQAHPSLDQARDGWARENAAGIAVDAPDRNYRDANHKPELICALTEFVALVGFREPARTVQLLRALDVAELASYTGLLAGEPGPDGLRALFTTWITLPQSLLDELVPALQDGAVRLLERGAGEWTGEAKVVLDLSERYPGDAGVLAALLLNRITLAPGEALYLPAGNLHAYLSGAGIELMANSDNVLRGGLTPKHVDVPELLRVLDFAGPPPAVRTPVSEPLADGWQRYDVPVEEFLLRRADTAARDKLDVPGTGARILLCTAGDAAVQAGGAELELPRGAAVYLQATDSGAVLTTGDDGATVFLACDAL